MYRMTTKKLGLSDLSNVLQEIYTVREKWFTIGIQLKLEPKELQRIVDNHKKVKNVLHTPEKEQIHTRQ